MFKIVKTKSYADNHKKIKIFEDKMEWHRSFLAIYLRIKTPYKSSAKLRKIIKIFLLKAPPKSTLFVIVFFQLFAIASWSQLPEGFSYVKDIVPSIQQELRYCNHNNFVGVPIAGYEEDVLITSTLTAKALKKVQTELLAKNLSLKVYDAYRPQTAVNHFVKWARVINDTLMKRQYYPDVNKRHLFKLGYIASKSGHSRGSSVDLTIIDLKTGKELDMGSPYDFFGPSSHITFLQLSKKQQSNRKLLQQVMRKHGFRPYKNEWWHFTLNNEPFPSTYFSFPVK